MTLFTFFVFLPIYTGLIGLFSLAVRQSNWRFQILTGVLVSISPFITSGWASFALWLYAIVLSVLLVSRPLSMPRGLRELPLNPIFWGLSMLLIALWSVFENNLLLSAWALIAAFYALAKPVKIVSFKL